MLTLLFIYYKIRNHLFRYFVLEHAPDSCAAYPSDGVCTFTNIDLAVDGAPVTPKWTAVQQLKKCNSIATVVDAATIKFTWETVGSDAAVNTTTTAAAVSTIRAPTAKWGHGNEGAPLPSLLE